MPSAFCGRRWCRLLIALVGTCIGFLFANNGTEEKRSFLKVLSSSVHTRTGPDAVLMAADPMDTSIDQNESTEGPDAVLMAADSMDTSIDQNESTEGLPAAVAEAHLDGIQPRPQRMEDATWMPWHLIFVNCVEDGRNLKRLKGREKRLTCPHSRCILTIDKNLAQKAKAMVLNPVWMAPYLVPPSIKPAGQVWVYSFHFESPKSHGFARKNTKAMSSRTDLTMTFQSKSDIFRPFYDLIPLTQDKLQKGLTNFTDAANKKYLLIWVVSNCACRSRMSLFKRLQEILGKDTVHLYGNCGKKLPCKRHDKACEAVFFQQYKFYAAFESSRCRGYITEKFFRGLQTSMVPLAYGGVGRADYERIAPKGAFLHVDDFASAEDLAKGLQEIDGDDARYSRFHEWRNKLEVSTQGSAHNRAYCELCDRIAQPIDHKKHKRSFSDLHDWMFDSCIADKPNWKTR